MKRYEYDEAQSMVFFYLEGLKPVGKDICWRFRASIEYQVKQFVKRGRHRGIGRLRDRELIQLYQI